MSRHLITPSFAPKWWLTKLLIQMTHPKWVVLTVIHEKHDNWACSQEKEVPCWVPRPWEKRIFLHYMLFIQLFSIVIILFGTFFFKKIDFSIENCQKLLFLVEIHRKLVHSVASQLKIGQSYIEFRLFAQTICASVLIKRHTESFKAFQPILTDFHQK